MTIFRYYIVANFLFLSFSYDIVLADYLSHTHKDIKHDNDHEEVAELSPEIIENATTIDSRKAKELFDREVIFIDTRKLSDWNAGRIPGAKHLDVKKDFTQENLKKILNYYDSFVIYCNGPKCLRSSQGTIKAVEWGYKKVFYYRDGFPAWFKGNNPLE